MGKIEKNSRKRRQKQNLQKIILNTVQAAGLLSVALLVPNAISAMKRLRLLPSIQVISTINRSRQNLLRKGFLKYENGFLRLTSAGRLQMEILEQKHRNIENPKKWDERWRMLIFDIPEKRKGTREKIRRTLNTLGFERLQDSVWIYPYDCEDLITLLKADFKIGKDILYVIVESLEYDSHLRKTFDL